MPRMNSLRGIYSLWLLVVLLTVALATSGIVHRIVTPSQQAALEYAQTFGLDISDVCGGDGPSSVGSDCDFCRLHAGMSLPEPAIATIVFELRLDPVDWLPRPAAVSSLSANTARLARAPPLV